MGSRGLFVGIFYGRGKAGAGRTEGAGGEKGAGWDLSGWGAQVFRGLCMGAGAGAPVNARPAGCPADSD